MSVDTVNEAVTRVRLRFNKYPDQFSSHGLCKLLAMCNILRDRLMAEDPAGFEFYIDSILAREPDAADFLLDALFEELNITDRDQLAVVLAQP